MAAEGKEESRNLIEYPAWLQAFPRAQRRFCRLCGRPVLTATIVSHRAKVVYDFEPERGGRYNFGGVQMRMHVKHCFSAESYLPSVYADKILELTVGEAWRVLWAALTRKYEQAMGR